MGEQDHSKPDDEVVDALLASARDETLANVRGPRTIGNPVPPKAVLASRILSGLVAATYFILFDGPLFRYAGFLLMCLSVTCFPNQMAAATGHLGVFRRTSRPSPPRPLLAMGWVLLSMPFWVAPVIDFLLD